MKNVSLVLCDQVRKKPACPTTAPSKSLEILDITFVGIIQSRHRIINTLITLRGCTGWSASCLFVCGKFYQDACKTFGLFLLVNNWQ